MKKYIKPNTGIAVTGSEWNITDDWDLHSKEGIEQVTKGTDKWEPEEEDAFDW